MFGGEVVERQQRIAVLDQAIGRSLIFDLVGSTKASNAVTASFLVSAIQISCSARLALVCRLFGILFKSRSCAPSSVARGLSATPRRAPSRSRARHRRPQSPAPLSGRDASNRATDHATIVSSRACHR